MKSFKQKWVQFKRWWHGDDEVTGWDHHRSAKRLLSILSGRGDFMDERWVTPIILTILVLLAGGSFWYYNSVTRVSKPAVVNYDEAYATMDKVMIKHASEWRAAMLKKGKIDYTYHFINNCVNSGMNCNEMAFALDQLADSSATRSAIIRSSVACMEKTSHCSSIINLLAAGSYPPETVVPVAGKFFINCLRSYDLGGDCDLLFDLMARKATSEIVTYYEKLCQKDGLWCSAAYLSMGKSNYDEVQLKQALTEAVKGLRQATVTNMQGVKSLRAITMRTPLGAGQEFWDLWTSL